MLVNGLRAANLMVRLAWLAGTFALLLLIVVPALLPVLGWHMYVVRGGSMEPAIPLGSIVVVHPMDPATVKVGEVITYQTAAGTIVTHRVTGIEPGAELRFQTKGDASASADPSPVPASEIVGSVEYALPGLGILVAVLGSPIGIMLAVGILAALLVMSWSTERLVRSVGGAPPGPLADGAVR